MTPDVGRRRLGIIQQAPNLPGFPALISYCRNVATDGGPDGHRGLDEVRGESMRHFAQWGSAIGAAAVLLLSGTAAQAAPPFSGTIFIDEDIITPSDPTSFQSVTYTGQGMRFMFD